MFRNSILARSFYRPRRWTRSAFISASIRRPTALTVIQKTNSQWAVSCDPAALRCGQGFISSTVTAPFEPRVLRVRSIHTSTAISIPTWQITCWDRRPGRDGQLAKLGVDGIIVANEMQLVPKPETEWELVHSDPEGRVYHRRGGTFERIRSVPILDSRPNEQFAIAAVSLIENSRNRVVVDVNVPNDAHSALLTFSRPFFRGYRAELNNRNLKVDSYRGLMPTVEIPAGTNGRLVFTYRPVWLVWGGGVAILCTTFFFIACGFAFSGRGD